MSRRILAAELKRSRTAAGLTHVRLASLLGWPQAKVSKIERAKQGVGPDAVMAIADVCDVAPELRSQLVDLAREALQKGWWESYADVLPSDQKDLIGLESDADQVYSFAEETIPELLQSEEYATAVLATRTEDSRVERELELLLRRQRFLRQPENREFCAVIAESALCRMVGGAKVLNNQLTHLIQLASESAVTIRVLPFSAGAVPADGPFSVLEYHGKPHPDLVYIPHRIGCIYLEDETQLCAYRDTFTALEKLSLSPEASLTFIADRKYALER